MQASVKERYDRFAEAYVEHACNGALAARIAGYSHKRDRQTARELVTVSYIKDKITEIKEEMRAKNVATRQQRQEFWTQTYQDKDANMSDRLRASELLGKSEADFTDIHVVSEGKQFDLSEKGQVAAQAGAEAYKLKMVGGA